MGLLNNFVNKFFTSNNRGSLINAAPAGGSGYMWNILEPFSGAWQKNIKWSRDTVLSFHAVFACTTLIATDISKLRIGVVKEIDGIWVGQKLGNYKVIQKPNKFQNAIQFYESWALSKITRGNAYIYKRKSKSVVTEMIVLNPDLVLPLVSDDGQVFYQLGQDNLAGITELGVVVPASEIIHDRYNTLFHPLVGLSPLFASGLAAFTGLQMQENAAATFQNGARPSGILTAPGSISKEKAAELAERWKTLYSGENQGKTAILGDDMQYKPITMTAVETQMLEQLQYNAKTVCSTFHVPPYKVTEDAPSYNNVEALELQYYSQCLQGYLESIELCLDEGLSLPEGSETRFDLDGLLRMDSKTQLENLANGVKGGIYTPNEARRVLNKPDIEGGDTVYLQQQMFSLEALAKRDASENPFANNNSNDNIETQAADLAKTLDFKLKALSYDN